MEKIFSLLLHLLFPKTCINCGIDLPFGEKGILCADCLGKIPSPGAFICRRCGIDIDSGKYCFRCRGGKSGKYKCSFIRSAFSYEGPVRKIIWRFKYGGRYYLFKILGDWMSERIDAMDEFGEFDCLVPVPMTFWKRKRRGYNQSELLAKRMSFRSGKIFLPRALRKSKSTKAQMGLKSDERKENVKGAFSVTDAGTVKGKKIILVDDVCTTGSTLEECAAALKRAGAAKVCAFVLARENPPR